MKNCAECLVFSSHRSDLYLVLNPYGQLSQGYDGSRKLWPSELLCVYFLKYKMNRVFNWFLFFEY